MKKSSIAISILLSILTLLTCLSCSDDLFGAKKPESITIEYLSGGTNGGNTIEFPSLSSVKTRLLNFSSSLKLRGGDYSSSISWRVLRWNGTTAIDASLGDKISIIGEREGNSFSFYIKSTGTYEVIASSIDNPEIKKRIKFTVFPDREEETMESSEEETTRSFSKVSEGKRFMLILDVSPAIRRSVEEESVIASKAPSTPRGKLFQTESL